MKHVHAEFMALYAQDALETCEPWKLWEYYIPYNKEWRTLNSNPSWDTDSKYRRKQKTIKIGNYDIPEPLITLDGVGEFYAITVAPYQVDAIVLSESHIKSIQQSSIVYETRKDAELASKAIESLFKGGK